MLREFVTPTDVKHIQTIWFPTNIKPDRLIWPYTDEEKVTVKIAYHQLREADKMRMVGI